MRRGVLQRRLPRERESDKKTRSKRRRKDKGKGIRSERKSTASDQSMTSTTEIGDSPFPRFSQLPFAITLFFTFFLLLSPSLGYHRILFLQVLGALVCYKRAKEFRTNELVRNTGLIRTSEPSVYPRGFFSACDGASEKKIVRENLLLCTNLA